MQSEKLSNPKIFGPGLWFAIHIQAVIATTRPLKQMFIEFIKNVANNLKCDTCKKHFQNFIDTHPFANYEGMYNSNSIDIGYFTWTWECHNAVNKFLGKYCPSLEEAYSYYSNTQDGYCTNCHVDNINILSRTPMSQLSGRDPYSKSETLTTIVTPTISQYRPTSISIDDLQYKKNLGLKFTK